MMKFLFFFFFQLRHMDSCYYDVSRTFKRIHVLSEGGKSCTVTIQLHVYSCLLNILMYIARLSSEVTVYISIFQNDAHIS
ncbi:hypothetical protein F5B21DRAFT_484423 [Xylaria acuta]|nr:hypothetical protein F5B21DRAFT_484423 [Xylaria acuta]